MESPDTNREELDIDQLKRVLAAALLTRKVFSPEALKGLQPAPDRDDKLLKPSGAQALLLLETKPGLSVTELAKELSITSGAMSISMTRLLQANYVVATQSSSDERVYRHEVTDAGRECIAQILRRSGVV